MLDLVPRAETRERSPLASARLHRQLTVEEAARRAGLAPDQVRWLEEARVYRFPSPDDALLATLLYASALGIDHREARELAGLPVPPKPLEQNPRARLVGLAAVVIGLVALPWILFFPGGRGDERPPPPLPNLPPPWQVSVTVLNGTGDINWTRQVASRIGAMAYRIAHVGRADRFDYERTTVYYQPGGKALGIRLARQLGVVTKPLPGGNEPRRLVVIVGPRKGPTP